MLDIESSPFNQINSLPNFSIQCTSRQRTNPRNRMMDKFGRLELTFDAEWLLHHHQSSTSSSTSSRVSSSCIFICMGSRHHGALGIVCCLLPVMAAMLQSGTQLTMHTPSCTARSPPNSPTQQRRERSCAYARWIWTRVGEGRCKAVLHMGRCWCTMPVRYSSEQTALASRVYTRNAQRTARKKLEDFSHIWPFCCN